MCEDITWDDNMLTGVDEIDEQHKNIVKAIKILCSSVMENKSKDIIKELLKELDYYVNIHFTTEENYMIKYEYENIEEHKEAHRYFKQTYEQIRYSYFYIDNKDFLPKEGLVNTYVLHLCYVLSAWAKLHFPTLDKEFCNFMKSKINN